MGLQHQFRIFFVFAGSEWHKVDLRKLVVLVHAPGADADELGAVKGVQEFVDACDALRPTDRALTGGLFADGFVDGPSVGSF